MPNICWNRIHIIGHKEDLDLFEQYKMDFQHFCPRPALEDANWYDWNCHNWGAKWNRDDKSFKVIARDPNSLVVAFETANAPPVPFLEHLLKTFPRCWLKLEFHIELCEEGIWVAYCKNGEIKEKHLIWQPPDDMLTTSGEILIPEFDT